MCSSVSLHPSDAKKIQKSSEVYEFKENPVGRHEVGWLTAQFNLFKTERMLTQLIGNDGFE